MPISTMISIVAKNPPSVAMALGAILALAGNSIGPWMILGGFVLQVLWLFR